MKNELIPDLPTFSRDELKEEDNIEAIISYLKDSQNRLVFYETPQGDLKLYFDAIDSPLYCCLVVKLCRPENHKIYEFFKLVLEAVYQEKKITKKGHEVACRIENLL